VRGGRGTCQEDLAVFDSWQGRFGQVGQVKFRHAVLRAGGEEGLGAGRGGTHVIPLLEVINQ
jgi:hypothetical protein